MLQKEEIERSRKQIFKSTEFLQNVMKVYRWPGNKPHFIHPDGRKFYVNVLFRICYFRLL